MKFPKTQVFTLAYYGFERTVIESQVLTPVRKLKADGVPITLLFMEAPASCFSFYFRSNDWRRPHLKEFKTLFLPRIPRNFLFLNTLILGLLSFLYQIGGNKVIFHVRGLQGASVLLPLKNIFNRLQIICDVRGIESEEYSYACLQKNNGADLTFPQQKWKDVLISLTTRVIQTSDVLFIVAESMRSYFSKEISARKDLNIEHIPCAVDVDSFVQKSKREEVRKKYRIENKTVLVFSGAMSDWQLPKVLPLFFKACKSIESSCFFLGITTEPHILQSYFEKEGIAAEDFRIESAPFKDVPSLLSAGDIGILLREKHVLNQFSCPTKFAEYLASGLFVVSTTAIDDIASLIPQKKVGFIYQNKLNEAFSTSQIELLFSEFKKFNREDAIRVAREYFDWQVFLPKIKKWYFELSQNQ